MYIHSASVSYDLPSLCSWVTGHDYSTVTLVVPRKPYLVFVTRFLCVLDRRTGSSGSPETGYDPRQ